MLRKVDYYFFPDSSHGMTDVRPSGLRVLAKSLHLLALGWIASVGWLWFSQIQQHVQRFGTPPEGYALRTLVEGIVPTVVLELMALATASLIARVSGAGDPPREWTHAFWWTLVPNVLLLGTVYLMILQGQ